jgi:hypothetical protein
MSYIIDFERINYLSSHQDDNPNRDFSPYYVYNITRSLIKEYMEIYQSYRGQIGKAQRFRTVNDNQYEEAVEILRYNKILLDKSDIRDEKIEKLLK